MSNQQIHKRLAEEQVIAVLENYLAKEVGVKEAMTNLSLGRSQFFNLTSQYKNNPDEFNHRLRQ